jgi:hypothetical protein
MDTVSCAPPAVINGPAKLVFSAVPYHWNKGSFDAVSYKAWRNSLGNQKKDWPQSPSIGGVLQAAGDTVGLQLFNKRGAAVGNIKVFISNEIEPLMNITNWSYGWSSCQDWGGQHCKVQYLPEDPNVWVAWTGREDCMTSRTLVHKMLLGHQEVMVLNRLYGDEGSREPIKKAVKERFGLPVYWAKEVTNSTMAVSTGYPVKYYVDRPMELVPTIGLVAHI